MSNTRVFDYKEISNIYNSMNQIIGDNSDPSSIAGLLHKIDADYHEVVNGTAGEDALAIYGDLGAQLLLNWENTAGSFPAFVENFSAWSTVVAQSAGDYAEFEEQVKGIKSANPLGWNSNGITAGQVVTSNYTNSMRDEDLDAYAASAYMYDLVGAYYVDTGMESYAKKAAFWNGFGDVLSVVSIVASGCSVVKGLSAATSGGQALLSTGDDAGRLLLESGDEVGGALVPAGTGGGTAGVLDDGLVTVMDDGVTHINTYDILNPDGSYVGTFTNGKINYGKTFMHNASETLGKTGTAIKNGYSAAKTGLSTAGTWVKNNGGTVLKNTAGNLGTSGLIGQATNIGQNIENNSQANRTAEMIARANAHFGNSGN